MTGKAAAAQVADDERDLVGRARDGDVRAFEDLVRRHQIKLYNLALSMCRDPEEAADITQEALLKAFRSIRSFRGDAAFTSWLFRIAKNHFLDRKRRASREGIAEDFDEVPESEHESDHAPDGSEVYERGELSAALEEALGKLPEKFRMVVVLYDVQGFSYEEIAKITGSSIGTVKSRLNRSRRKLKEEILAMREQFSGHLRQIK